MALPRTSIGPNLQVPGIAAELYVPDQLIAGNLHLVTQQILMKAGLTAIVKRGTILGRTTSVTPSSTPNPANTGNGTVGTISAGTTLPLYGDWSLVATDATHFNVFSPYGELLGVAVVGTPYASASINLTITAGGTAFVAGDSFVIAVPALGFYLPSVKTASDGSQNPVCILVDDLDTTTAGPNAGQPQAGGGYFMGEFNSRAVIFDASWTLAQIILALPATIFLKGSVSAADPTGE